MLKNLNFNIFSIILYNNIFMTFIDYYLPVKDSLNNVIQYSNFTNNFISYLNSYINNINQIVTYSYFFIKLYFLHLYDNNGQFPFIYDTFIQAVLTLVSYCVEKRGTTIGEKKKIIYDSLLDFYNTHLVPLTFHSQILYSDSLSQALNYKATEMITNMHDNISKHYFYHLRYYICVSLNYYSQIKHIKNEKDIDQCVIKTKNANP
jgi:hypothetical protein